MLIVIIGGLACQGIAAPRAISHFYLPKTAPSLPAHGYDVIVGSLAAFDRFSKHELPSCQRPRHAVYRALGRSSHVINVC